MQAVRSSKRHPLGILWGIPPLLGYGILRERVRPAPQLYSPSWKVNPGAQEILRDIFKMYFSISTFTVKFPLLSTLASPLRAPVERITSHR